jgi:hypothetical protein
MMVPKFGDLSLDVLHPEFKVSSNHFFSGRIIV